MLNKRHNTIFYHYLKYLQAAGMIRSLWIPGEINLVDLLTNTTMAGNSIHSIAKFIFHNKAAKWNNDKNDDDRIC